MTEIVQPFLARLIHPMLLPVILIALFLFGLTYNRWVADLESEGKDRGYMGFIVSLGCFITLIGYLTVTGDVVGFIFILLTFIASGSPMIRGSVQRHNEARLRDQRANKQDAHDELH